ncbi:MAG: hypothetical protein GYA62_06800 [Bacteroidales bacterium]|jgi:hypothetical protein|nr:hypothetical protein [Bacteroidales bacterium]
MSKELFAHVSSLLHKKMLDDGFKGIMEYRPFSDDYWNTKPKIVICNYENFGYQDCEKPSLLTYEDFKWWFDERLNKAKKRGKSKTVHYSVVFANALQKLINKSENESLLTYEAFRKSYWKYDELYKSMKSIMYMNLRPTSASGNKQEIGETHKIIKKYRIEMKSFILALDADIFILSTKDSVNLFNYIFDSKENLLIFDKQTQINNTLYFSIKHFGRPNYNYWYKKVLNIVDVWDRKL